MVQTEMPGAGATHREASQHNPSRVNVSTVQKVAKSFQYILFTGPTIGVVATAVDIELDEVLLRRRLLLVVLVDELDLGQGSIATVQHNIQPPALASGPVKAARQDHAIRLDGAVDA